MPRRKEMYPIMKNLKRIAALVLVLCALCALCVPAFAAEEIAEETVAVAEVSGEAAITSAKAWAAAILIGIAALGGALAMGLAIGKSAESIARQPEAAGPLRTTMMLGLVFIETVVIYALIVAILIIFVL